MRKWTLKIDLTVADSWVADGFNMSDPNRIEQVREMIAGMLPYAMDHEITVDVKIEKAPPHQHIEGLQNGEIDIMD